MKSGVAGSCAAMICEARSNSTASSYVPVASAWSAAALAGPSVSQKSRMLALAGHGPLENGVSNGVCGRKLK